MSRIPPFLDRLPEAAQQAWSAALARLDVVPREAFEQQQALLAQAEARLAALEARVKELSATQSAPAPASKPSGQ